MCIAATKFHFRPRLKFQFITDVRSSQFRLVVRRDNIVNIIFYLSLICSISFRALLSLSSNQSSAVSSESAPFNRNKFTKQEILSLLVSVRFS